MRVLFLSRTNLFSAPGGDLIQMQKTKEFLEKLGVEVTISIELEPDLQTYDLVHVFNLMEPQESAIQAAHAKKHGKPVALSTIYGLYTEFERKARGGAFQVVANILSPYQIGYVKTFIRHWVEKRMHKGVYQMLYKGYYGLMKQLVSETDVFLPNSDSEMQRVIADFNLKNPHYFPVPNAVDKSLFSTDTEPNEKFAQYKDCIVCAARIEGRKSTLQLVRAVKDAPYTLVLVGKASANQSKYVDQVRAEAGANVVFLEPMPQSDLRHLYRVAKVHALVSWMETPGLSSLEAAASGCNIVATKKGDTYDYFGDYAFYCEPDNITSIRKAIDKAYAAPVDEAFRKQILEKYVWEETAAQTLKAYRSILKNTDHS
ncbi:glycosyltransferase family 4 protein [Flavobacterium sp.]|uniref:glycosyltransferase family 4 protein n=1 Tax=Flavobacterium sp. TaxID=239 RepID=UPI003B9ADFB0